MIHLITSSRPWGNPYHGKFRSGPGHIEVANAPHVPCTGAAPEGYHYGVEEMDAILVQVPDLPEPVTTQAESEASMQWLNYALLAGGNRRLHGVNLGRARWIYIDSTKQPWLVAFSAAGSQLSLTFKRFGVFAHEREPDPMTRTVTVAISIPAGYTVEIDDIGPTGSVLALVAALYDNTDQNIYARYVRRVWRLNIGGSAGAFVADLTQVQDGYFISGSSTSSFTPMGYSYFNYGDGNEVVLGPVELGPYDATIHDYTGYPSPPSPGEITTSTRRAWFAPERTDAEDSRYCIGATVENGEVVLVTLKMERTVDTHSTADTSALGATGKLLLSGSGQARCLMTLTIEGYGRTLETQTDYSFTNTTDDRVTPTSHTIAGLSLPLDGLDEAELVNFANSNVPAYDHPLYLVPRRVCNKVYAILGFNRKNYGGSTPYSHAHLGFIHSGGRTPANLTVTPTFGTASKHPKSGELAHSLTESVCWV